MFVDKYYRYAQLSFDDLWLMCYGEETGFRLVKDEGDMYWIVRDPDFKSKDFYNLVRAKENCKRFFLAYMNSDESDISRIILPGASG